MGLLRGRAGRGSVNIHKTSIEVPSSPPYTRERVMATPSAWKSSTLQGADKVLAKPEKPNRDYLISPHCEAVLSWEAGRKKPKTGILPGWWFREGGCEHALRP